MANACDVGGKRLHEQSSLSLDNRHADHVPHCNQYMCLQVRCSDKWVRKLFRPLFAGGGGGHIRKPEPIKAELD